MTGDRARLALRMAAFAAAMSARVDRPSRKDVAALRAQAGRYPFDDALPEAVLTFCDKAEDRNPVIRYAAARDLIAFIDALNVPAPPDMTRRDIHG